MNKIKKVLNHKSPQDATQLFAQIRTIVVAALGTLMAAFIVGGVIMYGEQQAIKEQIKDFPSVNGLIVTQDKLDHKLDIKEHDNFMDMFCKFVQEYRVYVKRQDSINKILMKRMVVRGQQDTGISYYPEWLRLPICIECLRQGTLKPSHNDFYLNYMIVFNIPQSAVYSFNNR